MIEDDYHRSILEAEILERLNEQNNPNIVNKIGFYVNKSQQTTHLILEALNGMTLDEFISFSTEPASMSQSALSSSEQEETKEDVRMKSISPTKSVAAK